MHSGESVFCKRLGLNHLAVHGTAFCKTADPRDVPRLFPATPHALKTSGTFIWHILRNFYLASDSFADKTKDSALKEGIFFLVEDATGRLAATTMANKIREGHESDGAEFGWVAVNPDFRGHKLAEIVGCAVIDRFRREGYTKLSLFTDDYRLPALKSYLKAGWKPVIPDESTQKRWDAVAKRLNWHFE